MTSKKSENLTEDDLAERYVAALMLLADEYEISWIEAHQGVTDLLAGIEREGFSIDVILDDSLKPNTKH